MRGVLCIISILLLLTSCSYGIKVSNVKESNQATTGYTSNTLDKSKVRELEVNSNPYSKYYYTKDKELIQNADFNIAYEMCKSLLSEYYYTKANKNNIDFSRYISNKNLLKYSQKKIMKEGKKLTIDHIIFGVSKVEFHPEGYFYIRLIAYVYGENESCFAETTDFLVKSCNGKLEIADWYTLNGTVSYYDELIRNEKVITSVDIWENEDFVSKVFLKAGILID